MVKSFGLIMVEGKYVRRKRRKKAAAIISSICTGGIVVLMIVAFLGFRVGSFTVKLRQTDVKLTLTQNKENATDGKTEREAANEPGNTTHLMVSSLPRYETQSAEYLTDHDRFDNPDSSYLDGAMINKETNEPAYLYYFKYTFYIKNIGSNPASYDFRIRLTDNQRPQADAYTYTYGYDDLLRIRLYKNNDEQHKYKTYAKPPRSGSPSHINENGEEVWEELVWAGSDEYCTNFISDTIMMEETVPLLSPGAYYRYTILTWLEGTDPECTGQAPENGFSKFEINIEASQYKGTNEEE